MPQCTAGNSSTASISTACGYHRIIIHKLHTLLKYPHTWQEENNEKAYLMTIWVFGVLAV